MVVDIDDSVAQFGIWWVELVAGSNCKHHRNVHNYHVHVYFELGSNLRGFALSLDNILHGLINFGLHQVGIGVLDKFAVYQTEGTDQSQTGGVVDHDPLVDLEETHIQIFTLFGCINVSDIMHSG